MRRRMAAAALAVTLALSGCAGQSAYPAAVADRLQDTVLQVTTYASSGNIDAALAALDELERRLEAAHASGQISDARYRDVQAAIERVRAQLEKEKAAAGGTPAPEDGSETGTGEGQEPDAPEDEAPPATTPPSAPPGQQPGQGGGQGGTSTPTPKPTPTPTPTAPPSTAPPSTPAPTPTATTETTGDEAAAEEQASAQEESGTTGD